MNSTKRPFLFSFFCVLLCLVLVGCFGGSQEPLPELTDVIGVVTLDGKPLADANVTFNPKEGGPSFALTDENGKFTLMFNKDTKGATPGTHVVKIIKEENAEVAGSNLVPAKYNENSTLTADVKKEGPNEFEFNLTSKKK
ncbi:carboxypeptidase-like regulatory domain-containing protein [Gimesia aquarii]|uniref:Nickel uptake substrate-specific transmembrane region n=1 Tax=Gimesia aquarii TaxID=2527964 RepID=A0A517WWZ4_9PLAN|nr:carboxypeptidase-like regulatory domain-containing protein [Gimesia aquarii]QDU09764.1 hypothetical protein V202x_31560 [Gimesia aquarii]